MTYIPIFLIHPMFFDDKHPVFFSLPEVSLTPSERHAEAALELCRQAEQTTAVVRSMSPAKEWWKSLVNGNIMGNLQLKWDR